MSNHRGTRIAALLWTCVLAAWALPAGADDWLPVTPEEISMTAEPLAPRAPAVYLYRQVDRDDGAPYEIDYYRIKILTEEGRKYANVEIPYFSATQRINSIEARTIRPDGSIFEFDGTIYDKTIVKARGVRWSAKTFTLPDVPVGSIVEYRYRRSMTYGFVFDSQWILTADLFTKRAKFSLAPNRNLSMRYSWPQGLPPGTDAPKEVKGRIQLEAHDVPALVTEEYMPPEDELKYRVDFIYLQEGSPEKDPTAFWKRYANERYRVVNRFVDRQRALEKVLPLIVAQDDTPEVKLSKIYARVQQVRNLSYEREKSEQETNRERLKSNSDVVDVLEHGYGYGEEITWLFLALARAAGLQAEPVEVATRNDHFFSRNVMNPADLNTNVVKVRVGTNDLYFDPGTVFTPMGFLPWVESGVTGLRLDRNGGQWVTTPVPAASDSRVERKATLRLTDAGTLEGRLTVTYTGFEAQVRRLEEREEDATGRKHYLEQQVQDDIPVGADVDLINSPDWSSSAPTLVAEFDLKIPGWAIAAGSRALLPVAPFSGGEKHTFEHVVRVHPLYFPFLAEQSDDITVSLPPDLQVASLPQPRSIDGNIIRYGLAAETANGVLHLKRRLGVYTLLLDAKYYPAIRETFQKLRAADAGEVILTSAARPVKH